MMNIARRRTEAGNFEEFLQSTQTLLHHHQDDAILYEGLFHGYERDSIVNLVLRGESFTSTLIGMHRGRLVGSGTIACRFLPELKQTSTTSRSASLTMSSGIKY